VKKIRKFMKEHQNELIAMAALAIVGGIPLASLVIVDRNTKGYRIVRARVDENKLLYIDCRNGSRTILRPHPMEEPVDAAKPA
jgi:hypothetical protein